MDFVLASASLRARLREAGVDVEHRGREKPSDHAPAWLVVDDATGAASPRAGGATRPAVGSGQRTR